MTHFAKEVEFATNVLTSSFTQDLRLSNSSGSTFWNSFLPGSLIDATAANSGLLFFIYTVDFIAFYCTLCLKNKKVDCWS